MNTKSLFLTSLIAAVFLVAVWLVVTPARAADSNTFVIITTAIEVDGSGVISWEVNGKLWEKENPDQTIEEYCKPDSKDEFPASRLENRNGIPWCVYELLFDDLDQLSKIYITGIPYIANYIARWDGSAWHALGSGMDGPVRAIAVIGSNIR